jgi:hypothetical protein
MKDEVISIGKATETTQLSFDSRLLLREDIPHEALRIYLYLKSKGDGCRVYVNTIANDLDIEELYAFEMVKLLEEKELLRPTRTLKIPVWWFTPEKDLNLNLSVHELFKLRRDDV